MADVTIDVVLGRGECMCNLPDNLKRQVAPHRRYCAWLEMHDLITAFCKLEVIHEGEPEFWTAVLFRQRFWGPDPNGIQVRTRRARRTR